MNQNNYDIIAYTDGSCVPNPGKGGWAYIACFSNIELEDNGPSMDEESTNNKMELTAVIELLKTFHEYQYKKIKICSDSEYVIRSATGENKIKLNKELWEEYFKLSKNKIITFEKILAHSGNVYNERVDKLAKQGRFKNSS
jgi:ribonuclease HI